MAKTTRIENNRKSVKGRFGEEYRRGTRNSVNPIITIKARSMRTGAHREKRRLFRNFGLHIRLPNQFTRSTPSTTAAADGAEAQKRRRHGADWHSEPGCKT